MSGGLTKALRRVARGTDDIQAPQLYCMGGRLGDDGLQRRATSASWRSIVIADIVH
jgi:hypothetical protein